MQHNTKINTIHVWHILCHESLNLLKVSDILQLQLLTFYYKYKNRTLPYYLAQLPVITQADIHDHSTDGQNQLCTNKPNHEHASYSIIYLIPKVINSTPMEILTKRNIHSLQGFTNNYVPSKIVIFVLDFDDFDISPNSNFYLTI